jgi:anti-sigma factor RsiW
MTCREVHNLLEAYSDGELDLVRHLEVEAHLTQCAACTEQVENLQSLRTALSSPNMYHRAPAALRIRLQRTQAPIARPRTWLRTLAAAAAILLLIGAGTAIGLRWLRPQPAVEERLAELVVAGHVRSLQADHLTDVASTDQHTVKPWFRGRLDFSPEVPDLSPQGYALAGGRLDYLADRPVAALVYQRRSHAINLFNWPIGNNEVTAVQAYSRQGFHLRHWQRGGMTWWAISDLNDQELDEFVRLFQEQTSDARH